MFYSPLSSTWINNQFKIIFYSGLAAQNLLFRFGHTGRVRARQPLKAVCARKKPLEMYAVFPNVS